MAPRKVAVQRRDRAYSPRKVNIREPFPRFLIVCEGAKTEPNYFEGFRVSRLVVRIEGIGYNTLRLVKKAMELRDEHSYDQVWCVFDRDDFPAQDFNAALELAKNEHIDVAYSNEAFELWYLLHFDYFNTGITRAQYIEKLNKCLPAKYEKNSRAMYRLLEPYQDKAIQNAEKLLGTCDPPNPAEDNPSTTVHLLVKELRKFSR